MTDHEITSITPDEELNALLADLEAPPLAPDFEQRLLQQLPHAGRRRHWRLVAVAAAAACIAAVVLIIGVPGLRHSGPSAAEAMLARLSATFATAKSLSASVNITATWTGVKAMPATGAGIQTAGSFTTTAAGDVRLHTYTVRQWGGYTLGSPQETLAYDARSHIQRGFTSYWTLTAGGGTKQTQPPMGAVSPNTWPLPIGPTGDLDPRSNSLSTLLDEGALVRAALDGGVDIAVVDTTWNGRPAWRATIPIPFLAASPAPSGYHQQAVVVVDKETGVPIHTTYRATQGTSSFTMDVALTNVRLDAPAPRSLFTRVKMPLGTETQRSPGNSMTFYRSVAAATRAAGFAPVLTVPLSGMRISDIAFEPQAGAYDDVALKSMLYPALRVVYRRGLQWLQIETLRLPAGGLPAWFTAAIDRRGGNHTATLSAGLFAGREAHSWSTVPEPALAGNEISPIVVDSGVLVADETTAVLITGNLTRSELLGVAATLHR